ncbi:MAG TPA: 3-phosphoshikimate 1-carboxyvinyltransferase [Cyclobacteriaceae bacterium]|nr:3-phosphoshikimate 1-carboxyvinyltransferase [Cyclobacteriaceae bacterium]HRF34641.1 3-phosphoshikimate 1-carboxyvinyltransferase [Cyclobacteriaceae bacterium]
MNSYLHLKKTTCLTGTIHKLSSSKSISNRALILKALSGNQSTVSNLSDARDTVLMTSLVGSSSKIIDVMDAGTTMRFLTAYFTLTNQNKILTGTARMKERPIAILADALRTLGAQIDYLEKEGFPPIETKGFLKQQTASLSIPGNISSQYISALMMLAPTLPQGLTLSLTGKIGSVPYIEMTATLMEQFGVKPEINLAEQTIHIAPAAYKTSHVVVEADWSAISYWYGFTALAQVAEITLPNVSSQSLQGDRVIATIMEKLGVRSAFNNNQLILTKQESAAHLVWDFKDCPDLAQTVVPVCAVKGITGEFTGLESLRIKETDRIAALQNEIAKVGATLTEPSTGKWILAPGKIPTSEITIDTYHDHRMAMGFAPWATLINLKINNPSVVNKSYPGFWDDVISVGIKVES